MLELCLRTGWAIMRVSKFSWQNCHVPQMKGNKSTDLHPVLDVPCSKNSNIPKVYFLKIHDHVVNIWMSASSKLSSFTIDKLHLRKT